MNNICLVSYDISNNKLRRRVEKRLYNYGIRMQYSVFRCNLNTARLNELKTGLSEILINNTKLRQESDSVIAISGLQDGNFDFLAGTSFHSEDFMIY